MERQDSINERSRRRTRACTNGLGELVKTCGKRVERLTLECVALAQRLPFLDHHRSELAAWAAARRGGNHLQRSGDCHYSHQSTRPSRSQKCERHPVCRQTEGFRLGRPPALMLRSQRGAASRIVSSSSVCPHPQGQRMPTHQSSPASRARTTLRHGSFLGKLSPSTIRSRRAGVTRDVRRRHQKGSLMQPHCSMSAPRMGARGAARASRARGVQCCRFP